MLENKIHKNVKHDMETNVSMNKKGVYGDDGMCSIESYWVYGECTQGS